MRYRIRTSPPKPKPQFQIEEIRRELMPHQQNALQYMLSKKHPALLMEMRLGKSLTTIRYVQSLVQSPKEDIRRVLLLAPGFTFADWQEELTAESEKFLPAYQYTPTDKRLTAASALFSLKFDERVWFLLNYETLPQQPEIAGFPWDVVILDEATRVKNPSAKTTKVVTTGFRNVDHKVILTGNINPEGNYLEIFSPIKFLDDSFLGFRDYYQFRSSLFHMGEWSHEWHPNTGISARIKSELHNRTFILSRKQVNIGSQKLYQTRAIDMPPQLLKAYREAKRKFRISLADGTIKETKWQPVLQTWLQRLAGGCDPEGNLVSDHKLKMLYDDITNNFPSEKVVVWFHFNVEIEHAYSYLTNRGITCARLHGGMTKRAIEVSRDGYRCNPNPRILLVQIELARQGFNLAVADTEIYYSNSWKNESRIHSEDRIISPLTTSPKLVIDYITNNSADQDVVTKLRSASLNSRLLLTKYAQEWRIQK